MAKICAICQNKKKSVHKTNPMVKSCQCSVHTGCLLKQQAGLSKIDTNGANGEKCTRCNQVCQDVTIMYPDSDSVQAMYNSPLGEPMSLYHRIVFNKKTAAIVSQSLKYTVETIQTFELELDTPSPSNDGFSR